MNTLTLTFDNESYQRLAEASERVGKPPQALVEEWVAERLAPMTTSSADQEDIRGILRSAGALAKLGTGLEQRADPTINLDKVRIALSQADLQLSDILREQRQSRPW